MLMKRVFSKNRRTARFFDHSLRLHQKNVKAKAVFTGIAREKQDTVLICMLHENKTVSIGLSEASCKIA
jgi:hypothetical protein